MARRRSRGSYLPARVAAVLGGEPCSVDELLALIRSTNPTGLPLSQVQREARYAEKLALQRLLLRRHPEAVELHPTARPDVVGLRLRGRRGDAGHALRSELIEEGEGKEAR